MTEEAAYSIALHKLFAGRASCANLIVNDAVAAKADRT